MILLATAPTQGNRTAGEFPVNAAAAVACRPAQAFRSERGGAVGWGGPRSSSAEVSSAGTVGSLEDIEPSLGFLPSLPTPLHTLVSPYLPLSAPPPDLSAGDPSKQLSSPVPTDRTPSRPGLEHLSDASRPAAFLRSNPTACRLAERRDCSADDCLLSCLTLPDLPPYPPVRRNGDEPV